ncbi:MAG: hypothetical protein IKS51_03895 [Erysipelotrichaceae bacterium]|nr:hypothetical protein [Erysipelotrichaceae bacterium]
MINIGSIVWGVRDLEKAIAFWSEALSYEVTYRDIDFAILKPIDGEGIQLSLNQVTSLKAHRHHLDLFSDNQEEDVRRLIALGAKKKIWTYEEGADYVVLEDPDGNPFCVVQI